MTPLSIKNIQGEMRKMTFPGQGQVNSALDQGHRMLANQEVVLRVKYGC
jgi:hypothetical protein